jgi:hypothetical protein
MQPPSPPLQLHPLPNPLPLLQRLRRVPLLHQQGSAVVVVVVAVVLLLLLLLLKP